MGMDIGLEDGLCGDGTSPIRDAHQHGSISLYRSWRLAYISWRGHAWHHKSKEGQEERRPALSLSVPFRGQGEPGTVEVEVVQCRRTRIILLHFAPRRGLADDHGSQERLKDIRKFGTMNSSCVGTASPHFWPYRARSGGVGTPTILGKSGMDDN